MAVRYYDTERTTAEIVGAITSIDDVIAPSNNGKVLCVENGKIKAKSVSSFSGETVLETLNVTENGDYFPETGVDGFDEVHVAVPNTYAAGDEGKVVSNGALVAQTARATEITQNGTFDTTLNNSVTVNVSGGGSPTLLGTFETSQYNQYKLKQINGRIITNTGSATYRCIYLAPSTMQSMNLDPTKDFEIGCAFKLKDFSKIFTLFATCGMTSSPYASYPSMEVNKQGQLGRGISVGGTNTSWSGGWINLLSNILLNTWYFARIKYTASTRTLNTAVTSDFINYTENDTVLTNDPTLNTTYGFAFGAFMYSTNRSDTALIDTHNMYIKKENTIVFGCFTGQFSEDD